MRGPRGAARLASLAVTAGHGVDTGQVFEHDGTRPRWYLWTTPETEHVHGHDEDTLPALHLWWEWRTGRWMFLRATAVACRVERPVTLTQARRTLRLARRRTR